MRSDQNTTIAELKEVGDRAAHLKICNFVNANIHAGLDFFRVFSILIIVNRGWGFRKLLVLRKTVAFRMNTGKKKESIVAKSMTLLKGERVPSLGRSRNDLFFSQPDHDLCER